MSTGVNDDHTFDTKNRWTFFRGSRL